jgi:hypothetical protein
MNKIKAVVWTLSSLLLPFTVSAQVPANGGNIINTVAGGGVPTGPALSVDIGDAFAVVKDGQGNIYLSSQGPEYISKMDTSGNITIYAGLGYEGLGSPGALATKTPLLFPSGLALDVRGDLLVADYAHLWAVNATTGRLNNLAGNSTAQNLRGMSSRHRSLRRWRAGDPSGIVRGFWSGFGR